MHICQVLLKKFRKAAWLSGAFVLQRENTKVCNLGLVCNGSAVCTGIVHGSYVSFFDHLIADGAGFPGGQVTVATVGQIYANFLGSLHLELVHSFASLGNVDLVVALHNISLFFAFFGSPTPS